MRDIRTSWIARATRRVAQLVRRNGVEAAMDDEMRYHLECEAADRMRQGMSRPAFYLGAPLFCASSGGRVFGEASH